MKVRSKTRSKTRSKKPRPSVGIKIGTKIWVAIIELSYDVVATGITERAATAAAASFAARWLNDIGAEQHPDGRWTAERVEAWHGVAAYHVPLGGAVQA